jgi:class 3 adenylate cyclase/tetratricopeptide (TPR) repeat protein
MGGPAAARPEARPEARPTVTLVTSDLKGSTALGERLDPEALREVLNRYFAVMRAVFESHGGRIEKIIGDAIVAVFGLPEPADDDAIRAVEAAAESMRALATLNDELEAGWGVRLVTRTGVASGEVTFGEDTEGQHVLLGETVDVSGVMEQNAPPLEVLLAESTFELVRDAIEAEAVEPVSPKGSTAHLSAWRLVSVRERAHHELAEATAGEQLARDTRRTVTLVFAMAKVHPAAGAEPGPDVLRDVMSVYFAAMRAALEHHGGTVEKYIGDAVMAVFGLPVRHEDDAIRAVRAAADMQAALGPLNARFRAEFGVELAGHIGVNTGEVIATGDASSAQRLVTGDTVNTAARLEQAAGAGEVILGELTRRLAGAEAEVEPIAPLSLKGKAEPVPAYRLLRIGHRSSTTSATPFVGRAAELARLGEALAGAIASRRARLVTVVGDAGVGKSRLIREFAEQAAASATILRGRCLPYGNGITFWPLNEAVSGIARIDSGDSAPVAIEKIRLLVRAAEPDASAADTVAIVDRVAAAINLTTVQFPVTELVWGARRLLEVLARGRPVVFIIDDLQSAEATFLDLLDAVLEASAGSPIVLLCSARRELAERHPDWSEVHAAETISLAPLSETEAGAVVGELLGALDASVQARIAEAAEGNPLYLEQIVSMLIETGAIERDGERWVARSGTAELAIPPTVQALVAARLDALAIEERQVIEPASVIGLSFAEEALAELVEEPLKPILDDQLGSLAGKELVRPVQGAEVVFRFGHLVIRDTTYGGLLKRVRAALHERFVAWAERVNRERGRETEFEEILGYHLEQAYRYRTELGVIDDHARAVGERAAEKLASAGRRALARGDLPAAVSLLRRSVALLPPTSEFRVELLVDLADALLQQGAFEACQAVLDEARGSAEGLVERRLTARVDLIQAGLRQFIGGEAVATRALETVAAAIPVLEAAGDEAGLARAARLEMFTEVMQGHFTAATEAAARIARHARLAHDQRLVSRSVSPIAYMLWHGPLPVPEAVERCHDLLASVEGDRKVEAALRRALAVLLAMDRQFEAAREQYRRSQDILNELGAGIDAHSTALESARVEILAGDLEAAARELRRDDAALAAVGEAYLRSTIAGMLGDVLLSLGDVEGAEQATTISAELAAEDDILSQVMWRSTRARLLARAGRIDEAGQMISSAITMVEATEETGLKADALIALADVRAAAGDGGGSRQALEDALGVLEAKADRASAARVAARLAELAGGGAPAQYAE